MQETEMKLNEPEPLIHEMQTFINSIKQAITNVSGTVNCTDTDILLKHKCYASIAIVQGLASLNFIHKDIDARSQSQMLDDAIDNLINSLNQVRSKTTK
jgi:hypothetical protein